MAARGPTTAARDRGGCSGDDATRAVPRPLVHALDDVPPGLRGTAACLGCGPGPLLPALVERFRRVLAVDGSPAMLAQARAACRAAGLTFHRADLMDLCAFRGSVDVAVTMNAELTPDTAGLERVFVAMQGSLRPGGRLIGVFPAMESHLYRGYLLDEREREPSGAVGRERVTEAAGMPKRFYGFELRHRLRRAGFARVRLGRVCYAWDAVGDAARFPGEPPMWDWLVQALVPARDV